MSSLLSSEEEMCVKDLCLSSSFVRKCRSSREEKRRGESCRGNCSEKSIFVSFVCLQTYKHLDICKQSLSPPKMTRLLNDRNFTITSKGVLSHSKKETLGWEKMSWCTLDVVVCVLLTACFDFLDIEYKKSILSFDMKTFFPSKRLYVQAYLKCILPPT